MGFENNELRYVTFTLGGMLFEYDEGKNKTNIKKHGISLKNAARVFFDYDRIEYYDEAHSEDEDRYDTIGDILTGMNQTILFNEETVVGSISKFTQEKADIVFVVYTERIKKDENGQKQDVTRLISARMATNFERGLYYGKFD